MAVAAEGIKISYPLSYKKIYIKKASQFCYWKALKDNYSDKYLSKESII